MDFIGITGGVGAGKTEILGFIERNFNAKILLADEIAHELMKPGGICFEKIRETFSREDIFTEDGNLDAGKLSALIFSDERKRERVNGIVHPAVKEEILRMKKEEEEKGEIFYLILEAALLIEDGYDKICDRLWYIHADSDRRRQRLKENRGYSDAKIDGIFKSQLPEDVYRKYCSEVIDNNGNLEETFYQVSEAFARIHPEQKNPPQV